MNTTLPYIEQKINIVDDTRVIFSPILHTKTVSIGILVAAGSITETSTTLGYSHFLEHMLFKGTRNFNYEQLNKEFEKLGAYINAFTSKYYTLYYVHCLEEFSEKCLELLLQMVFESTLPNTEIQKEKKVIIEEIHTYKDNPEDYIMEEFYAKTFQGSFFGSPILGTKKTVESITQKSLLEYYKEHYSSSNTLISIAGQFKEQKMTTIISKFFSQHKSPLKKFKFKKQVPFYTGQHTYTKADIEQAHVCLGIKTQSIDISKHTLKLYNMILGGITSSRLYLGVREDKALCYSIDSSIYTDPNINFINIFASTQASRLQKLYDSILEEIASFNNKPITEEELFIAKNQFKSRIAFRQESISQTMMKAASQAYFYGKSIADNWTISKIDHISTKDFDPIYNAIKADSLSLHTLIPSNSTNKVQLKTHIL